MTDYRKLQQIITCSTITDIKLNRYNGIAIRLESKTQQTDITLTIPHDDLKSLIKQYVKQQEIKEKMTK